MGALIFALSAPGALAGERLGGPVAAIVERVVDGDTLAVRAKVWIGQEIDVLVRLRGIDAPELRGACPREIAMAESAAAALETIVGAGHVTLHRIEGDKYFGRVVADVAVPAGDLSGILLQEGVVRTYGGGARAPWCGIGGEAADGLAVR